MSYEAMCDFCNARATNISDDNKVIACPRHVQVYSQWFSEEKPFSAKCMMCRNKPASQELYVRSDSQNAFAYACDDCVHAIIALVTENV